MRFTAREASILRLLTNPKLSCMKQIADELGLSQGNVSVRIAWIYNKLGWHNKSIRALTMWTLLHAEEIGAAVPTPADFEGL